MFSLIWPASRGLESGTDGRFCTNLLGFCAGRRESSAHNEDHTDVAL